MKIEACRLCPRACGALRTETAGKGFCGMGADPVVARAALHAWEEPCISGANGSGAVFFTGCSLQCVYCQNEQISVKRAVGKRVTPDGLAAIFDRLVEKGAHNINLVNPTHFSAAIAHTLRAHSLPVPVVYNSGGYESFAALKALEGLVDVYLPDLKYASSHLAAELSGAPDYVEHAQKAVLEMARQTGPAQFDSQGLLTRGTLVRHLILPGRTKNSMAVLEWLSKHAPPGVLVSLMAQYTPCSRAQDGAYPALDRRITRREYEKVQDYLFSLGLDGYVQERESAKKTFIPPFNLEGVSF